jgi:hypothetical protein
VSDASLDLDDDDGQRAIAASVASFCAARRDEAVARAHSAHQVFGAIGVPRDGPPFHVSHRIRRLASASPPSGAGQEHVLGLFGL